MPYLSGQNSEVKAASSPLVQGPVNQSRDLNSRARGNSSISIGLGGSTYDSDISSEFSLLKSEILFHSIKSCEADGEDDDKTVL